MSATTVPETGAHTNGKVTDDGAVKPGLLDTVRGFGVMVGGPMVLGAAVTASIASVARSFARGRLPRPAPALAALAVAGYVAGMRPWHLAWGATPDEVAEGDAEGCGRSTRGVTIDAPAEEVWPWVAQLGQDRGGFYSYEWLENLAGCRMRNADRIHPEWQHREIGETVYLHPSGGLKVTRFEPGRALGLRGWGTIVVEPLDERRTRLVVHGSGKRGLELLYGVALIELPHFVMERRMLLGIKERAEARA
jgi:hypothetical protein